CSRMAGMRFRQWSAVRDRPIYQDIENANGVTEMDYMTATMADVTLRSLQLHPSCLAAAIDVAARTHIAAADGMVGDKTARDIARGLEFDAMTVVGLIKHDKLTDLASIRELSFGRQIMLFGAAAKLQCLPYHLIRSIADRGS